MTIGETIRDFAEQNGCVAGICDAEPLESEKSRLEDRFTPFVNSGVQRRIAPRMSLQEARSVIVLGRVYNTPCEDLMRVDSFGLLSELGVDEDYHGVMKRLLHTLGEALRSITSINYKIQVDSGPLLERALAVKAGLGFWGRSGMVVSPVLGPCFHIGCLITDCDLESDFSAPDAPACPDNCRICVTACPGKAIAPEGYVVDATRCISYLTQKIGVLTETEMESIGHFLYGCDLCSAVCPYSKGVMEDSLRVSPLTFLTIDNAAFDALYGQTAMAWRGLDTVRRNALIVSGNVAITQEDREEWLPIIRSFLTHDDAGIRAAAGYACVRLMTGLKPTQTGDNGNGLLEHTRLTRKRF